MLSCKTAAIFPANAMSAPDNARLAHFILRAGLAFAFLYPPFSALFDPVSWASYFPSFVHRLPIDTTVLLHAFGVIEVVVAVWILSGKNIRVPAAVAAFLLFAIVTANLQDFEVLFRDITIAAIAIALIFWPSAVPETRANPQIP